MFLFVVFEGLFQNIYLVTRGSLRGTLETLEQSEKQFSGQGDPGNFRETLSIYLGSQGMCYGKSKGSLKWSGETERNLKTS